MPELIMLIPIVPKQQKRHRSRVVNIKGRRSFVQTYKAPEDRNEESNLRSMIHQYLKDSKHPFPLLCALKLNIVARLPIPLSISKKERARILSLEQRHTKKPDCDNLLKAFMDCCRGVMFVDDKQVWKVSIAKTYHEHPEWEVWVEWSDYAVKFVRGRDGLQKR